MVIGPGCSRFGGHLRAVVGRGFMESAEQAAIGRAPTQPRTRLGIEKTDRVRRQRLSGYRGAAETCPSPQVASNAISPPPSAWPSHLSS